MALLFVLCEIVNKHVLIWIGVRNLSFGGQQKVNKHTLKVFI